MKSIQFSPLEQEMANFNFDALRAGNETAKLKITSAQSIGDVKTEICGVWTKIRKYVIWAENIPVAGKFITILADLLDSICGTS
jgi:hypothetical protein